MSRAAGTNARRAPSLEVGVSSNSHQIDVPMWQRTPRRYESVMKVPLSDNEVNTAILGATFGARRPDCVERALKTWSLRRDIQRQTAVGS
jgi:hypothetical protein